jgi:hypothetical protein
MTKVQASILYNEIRDQNPHDGLYVWVDPDEASTLKVQRLMRGAPFKLENTTEYHTTVLFHKGDLPFGIIVPNDRQCRARIAEFAVWDDNNGEKIVVALLDSSDLQTLHKQLLDEGLTHSFPDYNAHMTLGKRVEMNAATRLWLHSRNEYLSVIDFDITFDSKLKASSLE